MLKTVFFALLLAFPAAAQEERLNWQPLEVTAVEEDEEQVPSVESDGRFKSLMSELRESVAMTAGKKKREVKAVNQQTVYSAIVEMIETSYPGGLSAMLEANERLEDDIYRLIKMLPDYAFQYVGPFINEMPYVSDRILNIPQIKATKGKFPTRIAPQMREYAKKYGKYMSTYLYIYLMPEAWDTPAPEQTTMQGTMTTVDIGADVAPDAAVFRVYNPSLLKKNRMLSPDSYQTGAVFKQPKRPQTPADRVTRASPLTEGDVEAALASFADIEKTFGTNRFDEFHTALRDMSLSDNNIRGEMLNPMASLADKINRLPQKELFEKTIAKSGFTMQSWAYTVDKIIKARRVEKMSTAVALNLATWRRLKKPPKSFDALSPYNRQIAWENIQLFLGMYTSSRENLLAIKNYGDNIRKVFMTRDMMFIETPVYGIY